MDNSLTDKVMPLSLKNNMSWTLIGNIIYGACQWGIIMTLAKYGTPELVGQFALGLAITSPVFMFTNLQLRGVQATDACKKYMFNDYLALRLFTTGLAVIVIVILAILGGYVPATITIIVIIGLVKSFEAVSDIFFGLLQQYERMDRIAKRMILKGFLSLAMLGGGFILSRNLIIGVLGLLAANIISLFGYDVRSGVMILRNSVNRDITNYRLLRPRWDFRTLTKLAWLALPLGFVMLLISLRSNIPRYFIEAYLGESQLGLFAAMAYVIVVGTTLVNSLGQTMAPRLAKYFDQGKYELFIKLSKKSICISIAVGVAGVIVAQFYGSILLNLLYGSDYAAKTNIFVLIMTAGGISYVVSILRYIVIAIRVFRSQAIIAGMSLFATAALCFLLIPSGSIKEAAIILIVGYSVEVVFLTAILFAVLKKAANLSSDKSIR